MIRVLIIDDHAILRDGIRSLLESQEDIFVVGGACDGAEALEVIDELSPDIVLMDITMPNMNGLEATRLIKEHYPDVKVLILTQHDNREYVGPALAAGASGYVLKRSGRRELLNAIRKVFERGSYLNSNIAGDLLRDYTRNGVKNKTLQPHLTDRERQVLQLIVEGKSNKEIAHVLGISPKTVSVHRSNLMSKLGVHNTVELVRVATNKLLINLPLSD